MHNFKTTLASAQRLCHQQVMGEALEPRGPVRDVDDLYLLQTLRTAVIRRPHVIACILVPLSTTLSSSLLSSLALDPRL
jgi:hypothetical protein